MLAIDVQARSPFPVANPWEPWVRGECESAAQAKGKWSEAVLARKASREDCGVRTANRHW